MNQLFGMAFIVWVFIFPPLLIASFVSRSPFIFMITLVVTGFGCLLMRDLVAEARREEP